MKTIFTLLYMYLFIQKADAQFGITTPWTWMKGSKNVNAAGTYGNQGVESPFNTPGARFAAKTFIQQPGNLWFFGGYSIIPLATLKYHDDLWRYNSSTNDWTWMKGSNVPDQVANYGSLGIESGSNTPGSRSPGAAWTDHSGRFWIFGGEVFTSTGATTGFNDLWMYDPATNNWTWKKGNNTSPSPGDQGTLGIPASTNAPSGRMGCVSWTDNNGNLWLYGGALSSTAFYRSDLWKYDIATNNWTWMQGDPAGEAVYGSQGIQSPTNHPGPRIMATSWTGTNNKLYLFGGIHFRSGNFVHLNDLWVFDPLVNQWTWLKGSNIPDQAGTYGVQGMSDPLNTPGGRFSPNSFRDIAGNLWLFGGSVLQFGNSGVHNDLWKYEPTTNQWTWMKGDPYWYIPGVYGIQGVPSVNNKPGGRDSHATWSDGLGNFWIFGGVGNDEAGAYGPLNDLWKINALALIPVSLTNFTGQKQDGDIRLNWEVQNTSDLQKFYIQRSLNQRDFQTIDSVNYYSVQTRYEFTDPLTDVASQNIYYRLKLSSSSGEQSFSNILHFKFAELIHSKIYPNPASNFIHADLDHAVSSKDIYQLIDAGGKIISQGRIKNIAGNRVTIDVSNLVPGTYQVKLFTENRTTIRRFIKQ